MRAWKPWRITAATLSLWLAIAVVMLLAFSSGMEQSAGSSQASVEKKIDSIFSEVTSASDPGLAVLVRRNGHTIFERGSGLRDLRTKAKIDGLTNFRLASVTKQFTAMAVMLLEHDGKLRYDQRLTEIFPDFPAYGKTISIRNLLSHTSGLPDYEELMEARERIKGSIWTAERQIQDDEVLALLKQEKTGKFAPGRSWSYSNSGYVLLGLIVSKVAGQPFGQFMQDRVFMPLKMSRTIVHQRGKNEVVNRAFGHVRSGAGFKEADQSATSATLGDGGIYSNLEDLARWDESLERHALVSKEEMQAVFVPAKLADGSEPRWPEQPSDDNLHPGKPVSYGFGWFLDPYRGCHRMWHTGTTMGFRTVIERFKEPGGLSVIILCNRSDLKPEGLALQVADLFLAPNN